MCNISIFFAEWIKYQTYTYRLQYICFDSTDIYVSRAFKETIQFLIFWLRKAIAFLQQLIQGPFTIILQK